MKRSTLSKSQPSTAGTSSLDARRLTTVRGGEGLGIVVEVPPVTPAFMSMQHNETLVRL
jgi:hypothetical protein